MAKRSIPLLLALLMLILLWPGMALAAATGSQPQVKPETARIYSDLLLRNEDSVVKQDHLPFSDTVTGTVAFLDLTGDQVPELLFLTYETYYNTNRKFLNIYSAGTRLYQGQVCFDAVGSQREYEIYQLEGSNDLYCYTSFGEGSEGSRTYQRLAMENGQLRAHVLKAVDDYIEETTSYYYDDAAISKSSYDAYLNAWTAQPKKAVINNISAAGAVSMTYEEAMAFLHAQAEAATVGVEINGASVTWTDAAPFIDANGRTMVPLRAVADAMGLEVRWEGQTRTAWFTKGGKGICFTIDSTTARTSEGGAVEMDTAAVIVDNRSYAPIRYLAEYFGLNVGWDDSTKTVLLSGTAASAFTDAELVKMAQAYYARSYGSAPAYADVFPADGADMVMIQLYNMGRDATMTLEWYTVSRVTGKGTSMFSGDVDLTWLD